MRSKKRIIITVLVCVGIAALAYFACMIPFYIFETNDFNTSIEKLLSLERVHIKRASKIIANMMTDRKMESSLS